MRLSFTVPGLPATKGSTRSFPHRSTGRMVTLPDNPRLRVWEGSVGYAARAAGAKPTDEAVSVSLLFRLPRPKGHFGARGLLRASAPRWPTTKPDGDKMARAILDALSHVCFVDDAQVVELLARKIYATDDEVPGVSVTVETIEREG